MHLVAHFAGRWSASAPAMLLALVVGCGDPGQILVYDDAGFIELLNASNDPTGGSGDAGTILGCAIPEPQICRAVPSGAGCCALGERCVPALAGDNRCEIAGAATDGESCGPGVECGTGLLCAESATGALKCVRPCDDTSAPCPVGERCDGTLQIVGRSLTICTSPNGS